MNGEQNRKFYKPISENRIEKGKIHKIMPLLSGSMSVIPHPRRISMEKDPFFP